MGGTCGGPFPLRGSASPFSLRDDHDVATAWWRKRKGTRKTSKSWPRARRANRWCDGRRRGQDEMPGGCSSRGGRVGPGDRSQHFAERVQLVAMREPRGRRYLNGETATGVPMGRSCVVHGAYRCWSCPLQCCQVLRRGAVAEAAHGAWWKRDDGAIRDWRGGR